MQSCVSSHCHYFLTHIMETSLNQLFIIKGEPCYDEKTNYQTYPTCK